jgi:hypothetical protein
MDEYLNSLRVWLNDTRLADFMNLSSWGWPIAESIHLIGAVGMFDLRMMGFARRVPLGALHRLIPWGIAGYVMNLLSGLTFLTAQTGQYMYNPAFQMKMLFMGTAGVNVLVFYLTMSRKVGLTGANENAPMPARIIAVTSLACWIGVIICGRLLTFYRPPWHWCPWC